MQQSGTGQSGGTRWWNSTNLTLALCSAIGLLAFLAPLLIPFGRETRVESDTQSDLAPYLFALVTALCLVAMLTTVSNGDGGLARSKTVALLGVLIALDAALRLIPSVMGATPIFLMIMLVGAVFGVSIGFQMGTLTLLFSALLTGGVGPWLPFQMLGSGWIGMSAGWLPKPASMRLRIAMMMVFGAVWGFAFGALMNLWFWPFTAPGMDADVGLYWSPNLSPWETLERYGRFYVVTSLGFDAFRAVGNAVLLLLIGAPILRLLERYRSRFTWQPWTEMETTGSRSEPVPVDP